MRLKLVIAAGAEFEGLDAPAPKRYWYFIAEPAPAPHLAYPGGCAALRIVLVTVPLLRAFSGWIRSPLLLVIAARAELEGLDPPAPREPFDRIQLGTRRR